MGAAAYMYPRPANTIVLKNSEGVEIPFYPSDIKGLGSLNYAKKKYASKFIGGRCNKKDPATDENGRVIDPVCFDTNPGTWHQAVVNQIAKSKEVLLLMQHLIMKFGTNQFFLIATNTLIHQGTNTQITFLVP